MIQTVLCDSSQKRHKYETVRRANALIAKHKRHDPDRRHQPDESAWVGRTATFDLYF